MFLKAEKNKVKYDMEQIIFVTNKEFSSLVNKMVENKNVFLINREKLIEMQNIVKQKISLTTKKQDLVDRFDLNINDKFPYLI